jgi:putative ABC transport system substrate-binding protein
MARTSRLNIAGQKGVLNASGSRVRACATKRQRHSHIWSGCRWPKASDDDNPDCFCNRSRSGRQCIVASLSHPGGNVTGLSVEQSDIAGKRLELLREIVPGLRRLAIMFDGGYVAAVRENNETQAAARIFGLDVIPHPIRRAEDIAPAFEVIKSQADALYVAVDALVNANREQIARSALGARLPTTFNESGCVEVGGLMSYGPNFSDQFRRTAEIVDKILRGTKPGDIPVEQPTKFEMFINLKTPKALGLTVRQTLLATADKVIE